MHSSDTHMVLGASGAVGSAVVNELLKAKRRVIALERNHGVSGVETISADLYDRVATLEAIRQASYVYLCVGLPYKTDVWQRQWPIIVRNVLEACETSKAKLIFFDNVDMYGPPPLPVPFDELTGQCPVGQKAKVRKQLAHMVLQAHEDGRVKALIARSANFFGPGMLNSPIYTGFIENMIHEKRPIFLGATTVPHTYAYTQDNARAMIRLALDDTTYGEVWHLPVSQPITAQELAGFVNQALGSEYRLVGIPKFARKILGKSIPIVGEVEEMMHHFDNPYIMSWDKFHRKYPDFTTTNLSEAIHDTVISLKNSIQKSK